MSRRTRRLAVAGAAAVTAVLTLGGAASADGGTGAGTDGTRVTAQPDGTRVTVSPDGTRVTATPDGTRVT